MDSKWNERYAQEAYAYGTEPNAFLKEQLAGITPGKILFPAEGEGRNAVYAATLGWDVYAFDGSEEGRKKAMKLAEDRGVSIHYSIDTFESCNYAPESFDAVALIYAHVPADVKDASYSRIMDWLKPGGLILMEAFSKKHVEYKKANSRVGGPDELGMLFSTDEINSYFASVHTELLEETEVTLNEGLFHVGTGSVIRFIAQKK